MVNIHSDNYSFIAISWDDTPSHASQTSFKYLTTTVDFKKIVLCKVLNTFIKQQPSVTQQYVEALLQMCYFYCLLFVVFQKPEKNSSIKTSNYNYLLAFLKRTNGFSGWMLCSKRPYKILGIMWKRTIYLFQVVHYIRIKILHILTFKVFFLTVSFVFRPKFLYVLASSKYVIYSKLSVHFIAVWWCCPLNCVSWQLVTNMRQIKRKHKKVSCLKGVNDIIAHMLESCLTCWADPELR